MSIVTNVTKPTTACTLECDMCGTETLHRRQWGASDRVCQGCGNVNHRRPPVRGADMLAKYVTAEATHEISEGEPVQGDVEITVTGDGIDGERHVTIPAAQVAAAKAAEAEALADFGPSEQVTVEQALDAEANDVDD